MSYCFESADYDPEHLAQKASLYHRIQKGEEVFDATHIAKEVKNLATEQKIELIYVPANGKFQPLDRKIFGIVKKKLTSLHYNMDNEDEVQKHKYLYGKILLLLLLFLAIFFED